MFIVISSYTQHTPCDRFIVCQTTNRSQLVCCVHAAVLYIQARMRCVFHVSLPSIDYICSQKSGIKSSITVFLLKIFQYFEFAL